VRDNHHNNEKDKKPSPSCCCYGPQKSIKDKTTPSHTKKALLLLTLPFKFLLLQLFNNLI